jgi:hypothetical protein
MNFSKFCETKQKEDIREAKSVFKNIVAKKNTINKFNKLFNKYTKIVGEYKDKESEMQEDWESN